MANEMSPAAPRLVPGGDPATMCNHTPAAVRTFVVAMLCCSMLSLVQAGCVQESAATQKEPTSPTATASHSVDGISPSRLLVKLWTLPGAFAEVKRVTLLHGRLYIAGKPRGIEVIDARDGTRLWRHDGRYLVDEVPTVYEDTVLLVEGGEFVTVSGNTGRELSRSRTRLGAVTPLFPGRDCWAVGSTNDRVYGLFPNSGRRFWHITLDGHIENITPRGHNMLYVQTSAGSLYAVSRSRREVMWHHKFPKPDCSPAALVGDTLFIGCEDYYFYMLSIEKGDVSSKICLSAAVMGKPVVTKSHAFVTTTDGVLHAVDRGTYSVAWALPNAERVLTTTPEHVIFLRRDGTTNLIGVAEAGTGKIISQATALRYDFFAADPNAGVFYAVARNGDVLAIADRTADQKAQAAAPASAPAAKPRPGPKPGRIAKPKPRPAVVRKPAASEAATVKAMVRKLFGQAKTGDMDAFVAGLTPESAAVARRMVALLGAERARAQMAGGKLQLGAVKISGNGARVETTVTQAGKVTKKPLFLRRINGIWKIDMLKGLQGSMGR